MPSKNDLATAMNEPQAQPQQDPYAVAQAMMRAKMRQYDEESSLQQDPAENRFGGRYPVQDPNTAKIDKQSLGGRIGYPGAAPTVKVAPKTWDDWKQYYNRGLPKDLK